MLPEHNILKLGGKLIANPFSGHLNIAKFNSLPHYHTYIKLFLHQSKVTVCL